jgi:hypothetical protein
MEKVMAWVRRYWHMVLLIAVVWITWALMVDLNTLGGHSFAEWFLEREDWSTADCPGKQAMNLNDIYLGLFARIAPSFSPIDGDIAD